MTIGRYCQLCGAVKKRGEIIGEVHGVVLTVDCLLAAMMTDRPATAPELTARIRFCRICGAEQPSPLPPHCGKCGAALTSTAAAQALLHTGSPAGLGQRLIAFLLDLLPVAAVAYLFPILLRRIPGLLSLPGLDKLSTGEIVGIGFLFFFILYHTVFIALLSRTPAKMILGLRVVLKDGTPQIGWFRSLLRSALYLLTLYVMILGALLVYLYEPREKWREIMERDSLLHDPLSDTVVIKARG